MNGYYQVSNLGNVRSLDRIVKDATKDRTQKLKGKVLKTTNNGNGYQLVFLTKDCKRKNFYVHRLVAEHFIENPKGLKEINHKDFNKCNNAVENLEWVTSKENKRHYFNSERSAISIKKTKNALLRRRKEKNKKYKKEVISKYVKENKTIKEIQKELGIGCRTIKYILTKNKIPINRCARHKVQIKRDKLGRFMKKENSDE